MAAALPPGVDLAKMPAGPPPPGVQSNFVDPPSLYPAILGVSVIMMAWSTSFVFMRLYVKGRDVAASDACCVLGLLLSLAYTIITLDVHQLDRHIWDVPLIWYLEPGLMKEILTVGVLSGPGAFFAKLAILLLYLRLFQVSKALRYAIWFGIAFGVVLYWPFIIVMLYYCSPTVGPGDTMTTKPECAPLSIYATVQGAAIVAYDLYIFLLPLSMVVRLRLSRARKIATILVFGTASMGIVASICALSYRIAEFHTTDITWTQVKLEISISVENYVAVIVSCMPAVSNFAKRYLLPTRFGQFLRSKFIVRMGVSPPSPAEVVPEVSPYDPEVAASLPQPPRSAPRFTSRVFASVRRDPSTTKSMRVQTHRWELEEGSTGDGSTESEQQSEKDGSDHEWSGLEDRYREKPHHSW